MKHKTFGIIFLIIWTICCVVNIIKNMNHYDIGDWIVILIIVTIPYIVYFVAKYKKQLNKSSESKNASAPIQTVSSTQTKEHINATYIHTGNTIIRADGKPISDDELPYLIETGLQKTIETEKANFSFEEDELIFQFTSKHGAESQHYCNMFENLSRKAYNESDIDKKIELLNESIITFEKVREWHYSHSKGAKLYFYQFWECMHNSRTPKFSWVESVKDELNFQVMKRDLIIPWILDNSRIGFLQTEIYKVFPKIDAALLRKIISETVINFNLSKIKKGGTYFIKTK